MMPPNQIRPPELVPGRCYPVQARDDTKGIMCVSPKGKPVVIFNVGPTMKAVVPNAWQMELENLGLSIAPLVFRKHAIVQYEHELGVIQELGDVFHEFQFQRLINWHAGFEHTVRPIRDRNFIDVDGTYDVLFGNGDTVKLPWWEVNKGLVPLGTHIIIEKSIFPIAFQTRVPPCRASHVLGWLRYPEEMEPNNLIYVAFRVIEQRSQRRSDMEDVEIIGIPIEHCIVFNIQDEIPRDACVDYIYL